MEKVIAEVRAERQRQNQKRGNQNHNAVEWISILTEEVGEAAKEAVDFHFGNGEINPKLPAGENLQRVRIENYRTECIQIAAVAIQMVESLDRQLGRDPKCTPCPSCGTMRSNGNKCYNSECPNPDLPF